MFRDEIVEEIHKLRQEYARLFNYDLDAIYEDIKRREAISGRTYVTPNPTPKTKQEAPSPSQP
ncbi:hypothetical protein IQ218_00660 [Synechocystis salina LEGE 06099]|uniref:hypothetical protein n=1 Tax=Synechocystis salina TaxID=945780 RepID=UPI0018813128|nr:hypothetical protein [Synechocystis salina]MBE9202255.1 hypothetical protein [Synechocystis salina LEGE 06099]